MSQTPLDTFADQLACPAAVAGPDGVLRRANPAFAALLATGGDDLRGLTLASLAGAGSGLAAFARGPAGADTTVRLRTPAGADRYVTLSLAARDASGAVLLVAADQTALRQERDALEASRQRFLEMATAGSDAFHEVHLKPDDVAGVVHVITTRRVDGQLSLREFDKAWPDDLVDPTYDPEGLKAYYETIRARQPYRNVVYRLKRDDGGERYVRVSATTFNDAEGVVRGYRGLGVDVTAQVLAERALREHQDKLERSEQHLNWAQRVAAVGSVECDVATGEREWSEGMYRLYGAERGAFDTSRMAILQRIVPEDRGRMQDALGAFARGDAWPPGQYRVVRPDGSVRTHYYEVDVVRDEAGAPIRSVVTVKDMTELTERIDELEEARDRLERQRAELELAREEADRANAAKSQFLAHMSHEIRTPLNGVLVMAQAMSAGELAPLQRERLEVVVESGRALLSILNDILDLAKIEAGKLDLETLDFDLVQVVQGACQVFKSLANAKGVELAIDMAAAAGAWRGDPTRLRQIVANLVSNALKFTDQGEVTLSGRRTAEGIEIEVRDTGMGMDAATVSRLFGQYAQAESSTARRFGGTGLGLSICRQLAQMMGGDITVTSAPGQGSTFTLSTPLAYVGAALAAAEAVQPTRDGAAANLRILAAEDNRTNQLVLKTLLGQLDLEPVIVDCGRSAVEAWEREPWDLVLMDIEMPGMSGVEATRAIRLREQVLGRPRTPIVVLSANAMAHQLAEYRAAGADGHVAKPIETRLLFAAMEAALDAGAARGADAA